MDQLILALLQTREKLKATTLYHLLTGKKTSSILVYGYFTELLPYFGLFKGWSQAQFQKVLQQLATENVLQFDGTWLRLIEGKTAAVLDLTKFPHLAGFPLQRFDEVFWSRFLLAMQVLAQQNQQEKNYQPVVTDLVIQNDVKSWLQQMAPTAAAKALVVAEFYQLLASLPVDTAERLIRQFTGPHHPGEVTWQIYGTKTLLSYLQYKDDLHAFLQEAAHYPKFQQLVTPPANSVSQTQALVTAGLNFQGISNKRRQLKASTLRDHLLELAILQPQTFPYSRFMAFGAQEFLKDYLMKNAQVVEWDYQELAALDFLSFRLFQIQTLAKRRSTWT